MESVILAGGLGTRLQGVLDGAPKSMAPVNGQPFLHYVFEYLAKQRCTRAILSLGYKHWVVTDWLEEQDFFFEVDCMIEKEPLGTGGGILAAIEEAATDDVVVINGDTMFDVNLAEMMAFHKKSNAATTLALKKMQKFDRYGIVNVDDKQLITSFEEKRFAEEGLINGGVYCVNVEAFLAKPLKEKFSFEKDYLERYCNEQKFYGYESNSYFIDIGVPEDYAKAQDDFKTMFR